MNQELALQVRGLYPVPRKDRHLVAAAEQVRQATQFEAYRASATVALAGHMAKDCIELRRELMGYVENDAEAMIAGQFIGAAIDGCRQIQRSYQGGF